MSSEISEKTENSENEGPVLYGSVGINPEPGSLLPEGTTLDKVIGLCRQGYPIAELSSILADFGYDVKISHFRHLYSEVHDEVYTGKPYNKRESCDVVLPHGGMTIVTLIDENTLNEYCGEAVCSDKDNFCRYEGVIIALERAIRNVLRKNISATADEISMVDSLWDNYDN